ncbi:cupin domain-containing protein [Thalassomonas viridans]|uniref:Cupin domain-containing protein n=1 Tax=Thalassomonas viridans TaxID=137584 RepID=A0AAF0C8G9_9GAMM|nr:ChrR family anti-sigma-E factor [Thalassomonas viridans]WDE04185.1 cupin domain-containing protein [Thalassomonas viridans]
MIRHHPKETLLKAFVSGELAASLSAAIAIHVDMCPLCREKTDAFTKVQAAESFGPEALFEDNDIYDLAEIDYDGMIEAIVADEQIAPVPVRLPKKVTVGGQDYTLPQAISNLQLDKFRQLGKLSRARFQLGEGPVHTSLLHIQPGGGVPEHTHKGYELTLLLAGEFSDAQGSYVPGDFIMLDEHHTHNPVSEQGCLCYTVVSKPLRFTHGINRLLNPIGTLIY